MARFSNARLIVAALCTAFIAAAPGGDAGAQPFGLTDRPANPDCVAFDRPPVSDVQVALEQVFGLTFTTITNLIESPDEDDVWFLVLKGSDSAPSDIGKVFRLDVDAGGGPTVVSTFLDIGADRVTAHDNEAGVLGLALHPDYPTTPYAYLFYTTPAEPDETDVVFYSILSRFELDTDTGTLDPASEIEMIRLAQPSIHHQGGRVLFGPDGYLYVALGEGVQRHGTIPPGAATYPAQDTSSLYGSILRIDVNTGSPYGIPADNPFVTGGGLPEIYAYGLRNPWGINFDWVTGELWTTDVGHNTYEEVNLIQKGGNYGWPYLEGSFCRISPGCEDVNLVPPIAAHLQADQGGDAKAITGVAVYRGAAIPALAGLVVYVDLNGNIFSTKMNELGEWEQEVIHVSAFSFVGITIASDGELYLHAGARVSKLVPSAGTTPTLFPQTLADTGCFDPLDPREPTDALIPFDVNVVLWSDGATKDRWMALPNGTTIEILPDGDFSFPIGTILFKNFTLNGQLIETRLLMRHDDGGWAGYSYEWANDLSNAHLLAGAKSRTVGAQVWSYPSPLQCNSCHTSVAGRSLGPRVDQLNGDFRYPSTGVTANQLATLDHIGVFESLPSLPEALPALPKIDDDLASLHLRAKGYLATNCAHCHQPGGPTPASMDLRFDATATESGICNVDPGLDDLGVPGAKLLKPGSPGQSIVSLRIHDTGDVRMPPLGTIVVDLDGTELIDAWITDSDDDDDGLHSACDATPVPEPTPTQGATAVLLAMAALHRWRNRHQSPTHG